MVEAINAYFVGISQDLLQTDYDDIRVVPTWYVTDVKEYLFTSSVIFTQLKYEFTELHLTEMFMQI